MFKEINVLEIDNSNVYFKVIRDRYWACRDEKGEKAIVYLSNNRRIYYPQCNPNERIMQSITEKTINGKYSIVFIPVAYLPIINPREYFCD